MTKIGFSQFVSVINVHLSNQFIQRCFSDRPGSGYHRVMSPGPYPPWDNSPLSRLCIYSPGSTTSLKNCSSSPTVDGSGMWKKTSLKLDQSCFLAKSDLTCSQQVLHTLKYRTCKGSYLVQNKTNFLWTRAG